MQKIDKKYQYSASHNKINGSIHQWGEIHETAEIDRKPKPEATFLGILRLDCRMDAIS